MRSYRRTDRDRDRHDEAKSRFSKFCERSKNGTIGNRVWRQLDQGQVRAARPLRVKQGFIQKLQDSTCKKNLLTLDVKFLHHLQSTPLLHEYSGPSVYAMLGSVPGSPFLELCQVPAAVPLESLQWCRIFDPSEASAWGRGKSHRGVSMGDGGSLSCCSWPKTAKL